MGQRFLHEIEYEDLPLHSISWKNLQHIVEQLRQFSATRQTQASSVKPQVQLSINTSRPFPLILMRHEVSINKTDTLCCKHLCIGRKILHVCH